MSGQRVRTGNGITRQHGDALAEVRRAIEAGRLAVDPAAAIILADIESAVRAHAHNAAIVRVRVKNLGDAPPKRSKRGTVASGLTVRGIGVEWLPEEIAHLEELCRTPGGMLIRDIAIAISERSGIERTYDAVDKKIVKLGLERIAGKWHRDGNRFQNRPVSIAIRRVAERRAAEKERREADGRAA